MKEHFGTEPPEGEVGWTAAGPGHWTKGEPDGPRVAIVGGGPGGLFAAYILNQRLPGAKLTIFEGSDRCGGKINTDEMDGVPFEAGVAELYEYKGPGGGDPMRMLIEDDLGLETVDISGGAVMMRDKVLRDLNEVEEEFGYETRKLIDDFHKKMVELMPLEKFAHRWQPDNSHPWADKKFRECIEGELGKDGAVDEDARHYIETAVHSDLATESHTCNGLNGVKNVLMDNDDYMQVYHVVGGISKVVKELLGKITANIKVSTRVTSVVKGAGDGYVVHSLRVGERTLKEASKEFDAVVVAMPNHWMRNIRWEGKLAAAIHETCSHYDLPAHYLRVSVLFDEKWWEDLKLPGEFWMMDTCNGLCCYDESTRWGAEPKEDDEEGGHILSFLLAGGDALLMCSANQSDECVVEYLMQSLPASMREGAEEHFIDAQVDRYVGSINAQPGGWPAEELRGEHVPEPEDHPGVFLVGDYFFDSTLNAALVSANTAAELLLEHFRRDSAEVTEAVKALGENNN